VPSTNNLLTTVAWQIGDQTTYALEGSVFIAGAVIQWLRDELKLIDSATQCDELAASVPDSGGTILVPAFAGLGAPHWDPNARGSIFGLTRGSNRAQLCRAALESIALQSAELIACMERDSGISLSELRVDGGASRSAILMQIQANLLERAVIRPRCIETTALGAAYLAGLGVGLWKDKSEISNQWSLDARFVADSHQEASQALKTLWQRAVQRSKDWQEA
jgi:glycerol kinase